MYELYNSYNYPGTHLSWPICLPVIRLVLEVMHRSDVPDGPALRAHHDRVRLRAALEEADALEEVAARHSGRGEDDVAACQLLEREDLVHVRNAHLLRALDLLLVPRLEAPLHVAADAADGRRGNDPFRRAADAHQDVHARLGKA